MASRRGDERVEAWPRAVWRLADWLQGVVPTRVPVALEVEVALASAEEHRPGKGHRRLLAFWEPVLLLVVVVRRARAPQEHSCCQLLPMPKRPVAVPGKL